MNNTAAIAAVYRALAHYRRRQAHAPTDHSAREIAQMQVLIEYLHLEGHIHFQVNKWMSFGLIVLIFLASYFYARRQGPVPDEAGNRSQTISSNPFSSMAS